MRIEPVDYCLGELVGWLVGWTGHSLFLLHYLTCPLVKRNSQVNRLYVYIFLAGSDFQSNIVIAGHNEQDNVCLSLPLLNLCTHSL